jgi:hypothetical protein
MVPLYIARVVDLRVGQAVSIRPWQQKRDGLMSDNLQNVHAINPTTEKLLARALSALRS